jgi:hypothetical protein
MASLTPNMPRHEASLAISSISGSCRIISTPRVWVQELGCPAMGLFSPLPCLQTARPSGCKGARNAREPATNPCSATGASGSHVYSFAFSREVGQSRREQKMRPRSKDERRSPFLRDRARFPRHRGRYGSNRNYPWLWGQSEIRDGAVKECQRTRPLRRIASRGSWR